MGILDDISDLRRFADAAATMDGARFRLDQRRAAGYFQLYEGAALKDLQNVPKSALRGRVEPMAVKSSKSPTEMRAERARLSAAAELARLQKAPALKWTSGEPLTQAEVFEIVKPHSHGGRLHSGYVNPLPWGSYNVESASPCPSESGEGHGEEVYSAIATDNQEVPELDRKDYPHHFLRPPLRQYYGKDPLPPLRQYFGQVPIPHQTYVPEMPSINDVPPPPPRNLAAAASPAMPPINYLPPPPTAAVLVSSPDRASTMPPAGYPCSLCEQPIQTGIYWHKDASSGVAQRYCFSCHRIWVDLAQELARKSESVQIEVIDLVSPSPPHRQRHPAVDSPQFIDLVSPSPPHQKWPAAAHSSLNVNLENVETMDSPSAINPDSPGPSDAFSDIPQSPAAAGSHMETAVEMNSDDPADAFSSGSTSAALSVTSPRDSDDPAEAFSDRPPSPLTARDPPAFTDFSDSGSPGSAFSDLPTHPGPSHHPLSVVPRGSLHRSADDAILPMDGNQDAHDEHPSDSQSGEHCFCSIFRSFTHYNRGRFI